MTFKLRSEDQAAVHTNVGGKSNSRQENSKYNSPKVLWNMVWSWCDWNPGTVGKDGTGQGQRGQQDPVQMSVWASVSGLDLKCREKPLECFKQGHDIVWLQLRFLNALWWKVPMGQSDNPLVLPRFPDNCIPTVSPSWGQEKLHHGLCPLTLHRQALVTCPQFHRNSGTVFYSLRC